MIGTTISHYRIESKLGEGGMGVVYKAEDTRLQRTVALKFLLPNSIEERQKQRFFEEARNAARLHHPNICPIYEVDEEDKQLFFSMAYLEGKTVSDKIAEGHFGFAEAIDIAIQVADGLEAAHQHGIIHRDIKSSNIIVSSQDHAYILDFGLALRDGNPRLTLERHRVGTPAYMSPEQAQGLEVDSRTDIWSLGVVLFEMLTAKLPFTGRSAVAILHGIVYERAPSLAALVTESPPELQPFVERALAKDRADRWQTARSFASELRGIRARLESDPTRTLTGDGLPVRRNAQSRRALIAAAVGVPVLAATVYFGHRWLPGRSTLPVERNIAVLPFEVIGADQNLRAITDGLVDVLTAKLSDMESPGKTLVVPASEIRSRKITSAAEAKRIYGANLVITGSAQLLDRLVQFTVTLIDPDKLRQLGARSFTFDVQNPIAARANVLNGVLSLLELQLSTDARRVTEQGDTAIPGAYADYLKGMGYLSRYDIPGKVEMAVTTFQNAIRQDPSYALAYSGLAGAYKWKADRAGDKEWAQLAIQNAERAIAIAPKLAAAHATLGAIYGSFGREDEAIREFQRALQLSPGNGEVYRDLAEVLENQGRYTEAEAMFEESVKKRPNDWLGHLLLALFLERRARYGEAETSFLRAIELTPDNPVAYRNLAGLYRIEGRYPDAEKQLKNALRIEPAASLYSALGVLYFFEHRYPEAAGAVETAIDKDAGRYFFYGNLAMIYQQMPGKNDEMKHALRRALELGKKFVDTAPNDYNAHANLAEYHARLGEYTEAAAELAAIPKAVKDRYLVHLALVYELIGQREKAIQCLADLPAAAPLNEVKNDPGLQRLWADPRLQAALKH